MAERAHPDDPGFQHRFTFRMRRGWFPWVSFRISPNRNAFFERYKWVNKFTSGKRVLDIPCGMGWGTSLITDAESVLGVDIDSTSIEEARLRYGHLNQINFEVGSMESLPYPNSSFDLIACLEGIEHVPESIAESFFREAYRILVPNGILLVSSPYCMNKPHSGNPYHIREYRPGELEEKFTSLFRINETSEHKQSNNMNVNLFQLQSKKTQA